MTKRFSPFILALLFCAWSPSAAQAEDAGLNAIGALSASNVYLSYLAIGSIADGHARQGYTAETAGGLLDSILKLTRQSVTALERLFVSGGLDEQDRRYVRDTIETLGLLDRQAESYRQYIASQDTSYAGLYNSYRELAGKKIRGLLQLETVPPPTGGGAP